MGWSSGASLVEDIWNVIKKDITKKKKAKIARKIGDLFEEYDCDNLREAEEFYELAYPERIEEDEEYE